MATKEEITAGIRDVEERLERLLPGIRENLDSPLLEGTWSVHDALCHVAADANAVPRWLARMEALDAGRSTRPPGFNVDEYNQRNIEARKDKPVDEVVAEIRAGLKADAEAVAGLDDSLLQKQVPNVRGEMTVASDMLRFSAVSHNHMHLDDIEKAIGATAASSAG